MGTMTPTWCSHILCHGGLRRGDQNISIGLGSSEGKSWIHSGGTSKTGLAGEQDAFLEAMGDAGKAVSDYLDNGNGLRILM